MNKQLQVTERTGELEQIDLDKIHKSLPGLQRPQQRVRFTSRN